MENPVEKVEWLEKPAHPAIVGWSMFMPKSGRTTRASFNKALGEILNGRYVRWGRLRDSGKVIFEVLAKPPDPPDVAYLIVGEQVYVHPLKRLGVPPGTRIWFEYNDDLDRFEETRRDKWVNRQKAEREKYSAFSSDT